jgi:hypothetical protein
MSRLIGSIVLRQFDFGVPLEPYAYNRRKPNVCWLKQGSPREVMPQLPRCGFLKH